MRDDAAQVLLTILRTALGMPTMSPDDDFYEQGGDSLIALRVVTTANAHDIPAELRDILYHPTPRELLAALADRPTPAATDTGHGRFGQLDTFDRALVPDGVADAWPVSALQLGLIYLAEQAGDPRLHHDLIGMTVTGTFDHDRFAAALTTLCERHEALRSSFDLGRFAQPTQLVWSRVAIPLTVARVSTSDAIERWRAAQLSHHIDWSQAPLFRCHVIERDESFDVLLAFHHAIIDGWSLARLIVELLTCYDSGPDGLPAPPADGYRTFLALERTACDDPAAANFWHAEADVPPLVLDRPSFAGAADAAEWIGFPVQPTTLAGLRRSANRIGVPLKSLVLGCHAWALARWTGRDHDVVTGLTANGRPEIPGADLLVGLFLNTVPLRLASVTGDWADAARAAFAAEQRMTEFRRYPLARIERRIGRPAFDVAFNFTHFHPSRELDRLTTIRTGSWWAFDKASFPMTVDFMIESRGHGTGVRIAYDPDLLAKERTAELAQRYDDVLHTAAAP
jgi:hypothetical protein